MENVAAMSENKTRPTTSPSDFDDFANLLLTLTSAVSKEMDMGMEHSISKEILVRVGVVEEDERIGLTGFRRIIFENLNIDTSFLYKRVFNAADVERKGYITPKQLLSLLTILVHGKLEAQVELALRVYGKPSNLDSQPLPIRPQFVISPTDAVDCIVESLQLSTPRARHTLTTTTREKAIKVAEDLVMIIFPKLDSDKDGTISYEDFLQACEKDDSLVQTFGQFLPKSCAVAQSRPGTPLKARTPAAPEPRSGIVLSPFEGIDYLKHSPTLGIMWGRDKGGIAKHNYKNSERLEPIPLVKPGVKQVDKKKKKKQNKSSTQK